MKIYVLTAVAALALPFMTLGQTTKDEQQTTTQEQTKETQTTAPAKGKKMRPAQESTQSQGEARDRHKSAWTDECSGSHSRDWNRDAFEHEPN